MHLGSARDSVPDIYLLTQRPRIGRGVLTMFQDEQLARSAWRGAAIAAVTGTAFDGNVITSARLFSGPVLGRYDAHKLARAGHLRLLESSHPLTQEAPGTGERASA